MLFQLRVANQLAEFALRAAGLDPTNFRKLYWDVFDKKAALPADVVCPYFLSDESVNAKIRVASFGPYVAYLEIEVADEIIGNRIRERLTHYSEESRGMSVSERERKELLAKIDKIVAAEGVNLKKAEPGGDVLTRPAQESLMRFCDEMDHTYRALVYWRFRDSTMSKKDRVFAAKWLAGRYAIEKDPYLWYELSMVLYNGKNLAVPEIADALIEILKNPRYGESRCMLCDVLRRTKDSRATSVLVSALDEDELAWMALESLAKLRATEHVERIRKLLRHPRADVRRQAKKTLAKLGFPVEVPPPPVHLVKNQKSMPKDLEEWSTNLDMEDLDPTVEKLTQCVESGFTRTEVAEISGVVDGMKHNQTRTFRFPVSTNKNAGELWVAVFMDDIESPDLYIFATPEIIHRLGAITEGKGQ